MLDIPQSILDKLNSPNGKEPLLWLDLWPVSGPRRSLSSKNDWLAAGSPITASDVNVSATRLDGALVLDAGSAVTLASTGNIAAVTQNMRYTISVTSNTETRGNPFTGRRQAHIGFTRSAPVVGVPIAHQFLSSGTFLLDSMRILVGNVGGNSAVTMTVRIVTVAGNQVGSTVNIALAAGQAVSEIDVVGLAVSLRKGSEYLVEFSYIPPLSPGIPLGGTQVYTSDISIGAYSLTGILHTISISPNIGFEIAGKNGFAASGSAYRAIDVGGVPITDGVLTFSDVVPAGGDPTSMTVEAFYSDDPAALLDPLSILWVSHGLVDSGGLVPPHEYWLILISMTSNTLNDETPELHDIAVKYNGEMQTFGKYAELGLIPQEAGLQQITVNAGLDSMSSASSQIIPKVIASMKSEFNAILADVDGVASLINTQLRGKPARMRAGFLGVAESFVLSEGQAKNLKFGGSKYTLPVIDALELIDVQIPRDKAGPSWDSVTAYAVGKVVVFGTNSWSALIANTNSQPSLTNVNWKDEGTVWNKIIYSPVTNGGQPWHLANILIDLLKNRVNVPSQLLDESSILQFVTLYPSRTGKRTIDTPEKALAMINEIAWLLEGLWARRLGVLTLIPEPTALSPAIEHISDNDIKLAVTYNRGFDAVVNERLILTDYIGTGNGNESFADGEGYVDAVSVLENDGVQLEVFKDKWGVPHADLQTLAQNDVERWVNGRRSVGFQANMRLGGLEGGDVVTFASQQLPRADKQLLRMMVMKSDPDWPNQKIKMTLLEVL